MKIIVVIGRIEDECCDIYVKLINVGLMVNVIEVN